MTKRKVYRHKMHRQTFFIVKYIKKNERLDEYEKTHIYI